MQNRLASIRPRTHSGWIGTFFINSPKWPKTLSCIPSLLRPYWYVYSGSLNQQKPIPQRNVKHFAISVVAVNTNNGVWCYV